MAISVEQLLAREQVTRVIRTFDSPQTRFQDWLGMGPGGRNTEGIRGRNGAFDILDPIRRAATVRAPIAPPATVKPRIIGHVPFTVLRSHEKIPLLDEKIFLQRPLGRPYGELDEGGVRYITREQANLSQRLKNLREFAISRMLRGGFQVLQSGDDWLVVDSGGTFSIDFGIPAANKTQLDMLGGGNLITASWATAGTDIIGNLLSIDAAFQQLTGRRLRHVWINSVVFGYLLNNTGFKNAAGTANTVWESYTRSSHRTPEGNLDAGFDPVIFKAVPWVLFHVYNGGMEVGVSDTYTKFIPDTVAILTPELDGDSALMYEGSEPIAEHVRDRGREVQGMAAWTERKTQPPSWELITVDNFLPVLSQPKTIAYATVVF